MLHPERAVKRAMRVGRKYREEEDCPHHQCVARERRTGIPHRDMRWKGLNRSLITAVVARRTVENCTCYSSSSVGWTASTKYMGSLPRGDGAQRLDGPDT